MSTEHLPVFDDLSLQDVVVQQRFTLTRDTLVRYAGASLDFNPIHYRDDIAQSVGLPGVLAHGMLTMGAAASPVAEWLGAAGWVSDYRVRFTRPVLVPADGGADVTITATVASIDPETREARLDLGVVFQERTVLGRAQLTVRFV